MKETVNNLPNTNSTPLGLDELEHAPDAHSIDVNEADLAVSGFADEVKRLEEEQAAATRHDALALGGINSVEAVGDQKIVAGLVEARGYVRRAPKLQEQLTDDSRTKPFRFFRKTKGNSGAFGETTEIEGLRELRDFLQDFVAISAGEDDLAASHRDLVKQASGMLEDTTFIGDKEYREAAEGLGMYWKQFLDEDPSRTLCVLAEVGELDRYKKDGRRKSDHYLRDQILQTFSDEELERYSGRIVGKISDLRADPSDVKIVMLDDWTISGTQMRSVYGGFADHPSFRRFINAGSVEINLIVGSEGHLQNGLVIDPYQDESPTIPIRSYFMSHHAKDSHKEHKGFVSGLHSSVNFDFKIPMKDMATRLQKLGKPRISPALIWIRGAYEDPQRIDISRENLVRLADDTEDVYES